MPATRGKPVGPEDDANVRRLHAEGKSRNDIARATGRSGRTVSRIAERLGLTFERGAMVIKATEARKIDARAKRSALALRLLDDAEMLRQQLFAPCTVHNFGGKDNTFNSEMLARPPFRDQREIMSAIGIAVDRAVRLDEYDSGAGLGQVVSLLEQLGKGLVGKYGSGDDEHPVDPDPANG